jgi:hypothetical protein
MPRGGSKPGERRGGRQKGSLNKLSIGRMKAQLAVRAPEFDPYDQLEIIAKTFLERARVEQHRDKPNMRLGRYPMPRLRGASDCRRQCARSPARGATNLPPCGSERRLALGLSWGVERKRVLLDREASLKA